MVESLCEDVWGLCVIGWVEVLVMLGIGLLFGYCVNGVKYGIKCEFIDFELVEVSLVMCLM